MKSILFILVTFAGFNLQPLMAQNNDNTYSDCDKLTRYIIERDLIESEKNPAAAFGLSVICPGLGQMYNGSVGGGFIFLLGTIGGFAFYQFSDSKPEAGLWIGCASWLISAIAAPVEASLINSDIRWQKEILNKKYISYLEYHTKIGTLQINPGVNKNGYGVSVNFNF